MAQKDGELNLIFIFDVVDIDNIPGQGRMALRDWEMRDLVKPIEKWQTMMIKRGDGTVYSSKITTTQDRCRGFAMILMNGRRRAQSC